MHITILTLFPSMFEGPFGESIVKRAIDKGIVDVQTRNIRDHARDKHRVVDDSAYGGGPGMLMKPEPVFEAVEQAKQGLGEVAAWVVLLTPQGRLFTQAVATELAAKSHLILICGHYEGVDDRVRQHLADDEISIGDYVLSGGEPAAVVLVDAMVRLLPGALGDPTSAQGDSFAGGLLQHPEYTRPAIYRGWEVPEVLLSGDHKAVDRWRRRQSILRTLRRRPELVDQAGLSPEEVADALRSETEGEGT